METIYSITKPERKTDEPFTLCFYSRVKLTAIELEETNTGKRLKWVFKMRNDERTIVGYTKYSTWYRSKCANWVQAVMNKNQIPTRIDLSQLIGNEVGCCVAIKHNKDGTERLVARDLYNHKV